MFAKTDIVHHQQEGASIEEILLGLACAVVRNYRVSVMKKLPQQKPIMLAGGVSCNKGIIEALYGLLALQDDELIVTDQVATLGAVGVVRVSLQEQAKINCRWLAQILEENEPLSLQTKPLHPRLNRFGTNDGESKHDLQNREAG